MWPPALLRPSPPPELVYLDMNHWINLAQAATGHPNGAAHLEALEICKAARASNTALFPLAAAHYFEMAKIKDPRQRRDVAAVMEELSSFATLLDRTTVMGVELRAALDAVTGGPGLTITVALLGRGIGPAFGMRGGLRVRDANGEDVTDEFVAVGDNASALASANLSLERAMLAGPEDKDLAALAERGYDPLAAFKVAQRRADQEEGMRARLDADPRWRRGRIYDVVAAYEMSNELLDPLEKACAERGYLWQDVQSERETLRRFTRSMPSTEVAIVLKATRHRDGTLRWTPNDITDVDALSLAVPYCDVVVTEKYAHHVLVASGVAKRMSTVVLPSTSQLADHFAGVRGALNSDCGVGLSAVAQFAIPAVLSSRSVKGRAYSCSVEGCASREYSTVSEVASNIARVRTPSPGASTRGGVDLVAVLEVVQRAFAVVY